jgi:glycosyltransferase involved in cell wall biosynthesis
VIGVKDDSVARGNCALHVVHVINSLDRGGAETNLARLCDATARCGVSNVVVTLRGHGALRAEVERHSRVVGIGAALELVRLRAGRNFDAPQLIVGWMYLGCVAASWLAPRQTPVIWSLRHVPDVLARESRATRIALLLLRRMSGERSRRRPALVITNSAAAHEAHLRLGLTGSYRVIQNGVDTERFQIDRSRGNALRGELGIGRDATLLLQVGRVHLHKGQHILLDAAVPLLTQHPTVHLLLVGHGTESIRHPLLDTPALACRVHRIGDQADLVPAYSAADALVNPSTTDSFPTAVIEAMSCTLPCIVTDTGASRAIVGENGICIAAGSADALRKAVEALLDESRDAWRERGEQGRRRVIERFSLAQMASGFVAAYRTAVAA